MKILASIIAGVVVVGAVIFGISSMTGTSSTATSTNATSTATSTGQIGQTGTGSGTGQTTGGTDSSVDFGKCDLRGYSSVKVAGSGLGLKDLTLTIQGDKAIQTKKVAGSDMVIDRTTSICAGWIDSYKTSMSYNTLDSAYNPKGINTKGVWFSMIGNSSTNLKEITENGKAVLVYENRTTISGKPGYVSIFQRKADKVRGLNISVTDIVYKSNDLMLSTPIEAISKTDAVQYTSATFTYQ